MRFVSPVTSEPKPDPGQCKVSSPTECILRLFIKPGGTQRPADTGRG